MPNVVFTNDPGPARAEHPLGARPEHFDPGLRRKRLMTLVQLFLIHRYKIDSVHYLTPTEDNQRQTEGMKRRGIFSAVNDEVGEIIVADVDTARVKQLLKADKAELKQLISKG